jgi:adenylosuccinate synthase
MFRDFFQPGKASVIVGGQFGSEAKGLVASYLALKYLDYRSLHHNGAIVCTTNAGAQAGHTTILPDGRKFVCYHLPTMGVLIPDSKIYLNAGSIIDPGLLEVEIEKIAGVLDVDPMSIINRIIIHPAAAVICDHHKDEEASETRHIGSTMKGVGAALRDKIMRKPGATAKDHDVTLDSYYVMPFDLNNAMSQSGTIVTVEIPQGTGLSINASGMWPHTTSRDCWVTQGLSDAGIHPSFLHRTAMVQRTFPIRVGNIGLMSADNRHTPGYSGDFYYPSKELDWSTHFAGITPERTTVTNRVRRIATWSDRQYAISLRLNRPDYVFTTFTNYMSATELMSLAAQMDAVEHEVGIHVIHQWSWGPRSDQISPTVLGIPEDSFRGPAV